MLGYTDDFDFLNGLWNVHNRYLKGRLKGPQSGWNSRPTQTLILY